MRSCGTYTDDVWKEVWQRHGAPVFRHYHGMTYTMPAMLRLLHQQDADTLFKPEFFEVRESKNIGQTFVVVKPVAQFKDGAVELKYNVGTRTNGVDQPVWPKDLSVEVVTGSN